MVVPLLSETGCRSYRPLADPSIPDAMVSLEEWDGEAALQFYFEIPHFKHVSGVLEKILAERFKLRRFVAQAGAESV